MLHERKFSGLTCQWCYRTHLKKMEDVVNKKPQKIEVSEVLLVLLVVLIRLMLSMDVSVLARLTVESRWLCKNKPKLKSNLHKYYTLLQNFVFVQKLKIE